MTPAEIAAYIGAAAWLPQLAKPLYSRFRGPILTAVPSQTVSIGYTTYGPIVNFTCAISTERKDALIVKAELTVRHEKGDQRDLTWAWIQETSHQIRNPATGETAEVTKQQTAVALQISTLSMAEKLMGFQDQEFLDKARELMGRTERAYVALRREMVGPDPQLSTPEFQQAFAESEAGREYQDFYVNSMYWKEGRYDLTLKLYEKRSGKPQTEKFVVELRRQTSTFYERTPSIICWISQRSSVSH